MNKIEKNIKYLFFKFKHKGYKNLMWEGKNMVRVECELDKNSIVSVQKDVFFRNGCSIRVRKGAKLSIGHNVSFSDNCILTCRDTITIGDNVMFGPNTIIFDNDHDYRSDDYQNTFVTSPIVIEDNVWIGGNVCILRGSHIKKGSVVGAGTVVRNVVEADCICYNEKTVKLKKIHK